MRHFYHNISLYNNDDLAYWAGEALQWINSPYLLSGGSSGCALASGMLSRASVPLEHTSIYTKERSSHRGEGYLKDESGFRVGRFPLGGMARPTDLRFNIVDDLIDTGATISSLIATAPRIVSRIIVCDIWGDASAATLSMRYGIEIINLSKVE